MKLLILLLAFNIGYCQSSIIAAGNQTETIGEVFPIMQQDLKEKEISLGIPKFEVPIEKPIIKKKINWWQKLLKLLGL